MWLYDPVIVSIYCSVSPAGCVCGDVLPTVSVTCKHLPFIAKGDLKSWVFFFMKCFGSDLQIEFHVWLKEEASNQTFSSRLFSSHSKTRSSIIHQESPGCLRLWLRSSESLSRIMLVVFPKTESLYLQQEAILIPWRDDWEMLSHWESVFDQWLDEDGMTVLPSCLTFSKVFFLLSSSSWFCKKRKQEATLQTNKLLMSDVACV